MRRLLATSLLFLAKVAMAQEHGDCDRGEAENYLDGNNVRARLLNSGGLFCCLVDTRIIGYEVPAGSGIDAVFAMPVWIGGRVDGEVRFIGGGFSGRELWPGPLSPEGNPPADCSTYDRIWNVSLEDVARYNTTGETTPDLLDWPVELGAPVLDGDGIEGNYNLPSGDRPALLGSETAFWVVNDRGNSHDWSNTDPIGLEVRATAFAFSEFYAHNRLTDIVPFAADVAAILENTTLYRYELIYRGEAPLDSAFVGLRPELDLGYGHDDYVGSMPELGIGYVYNGDNYDEDTISRDGEVTSRGYGEAPPAMGFVFLSGPAERAMSSFLITSHNGDPVVGNPSDGNDAYQFLRGRWKDGSAISFGRDGRPGHGEPTRYMFPDRPPNYWSEENRDGTGRRNGPGSRHFIMSHGPFQMQPGESVTIDFAIAWSRGQSRLASVSQLQLEVPLLHAAPLDPDPRLRTLTLQDLEAMQLVPEPEESPSDYYRFSATPNPAEGPISIRYELPEGVSVRIALYDVLGRELRLVEEGEQSAGVYSTRLDGSGLPSGTYMLQVQFGNLTATKPITVFR